MPDSYFDKLRETIEERRKDPKHTLDSVSEEIKKLYSMPGPLQANSVDSKYRVFFSVSGNPKSFKDIDIGMFCGDYNLSHETKPYYIGFYLKENPDERIAYITYNPHTIAIDLSVEKAPELLQVIGETFFNLKY